MTKTKKSIIPMEHWRSHIVMSNPTAKMGLRRRPYAFGFIRHKN